MGDAAEWKRRFRVIEKELKSTSLLHNEESFVFAVLTRFQAISFSASFSEHDFPTPCSTWLESKTINSEFDCRDLSVYHLKQNEREKIMNVHFKPTSCGAEWNIRLVIQNV